MKTKTITLYSFDELSEKAKQRAFNKWLKCEYECGNPWQGENEGSLKAFLNLFSCKLSNRGFITCTEREEISSMSGVRLAAYIWNNYRKDIFKGKYFSKGSKSRYSKIFLEESYSLTGYCMDYDILKPIYDFLKKPDNTDFEQLLYECYQSWEHACERDDEYRLSLESFIESCQANEYTFTEDGTLCN